MKLAIQTLLVPGAMLAEQFDAAARFGFDAVELAAGPDFDVRAQFTEIERASTASGLPVSDICTHPIHDPLHPDGAEQTQRLAVLKDLLAAAEALGARGVVSVPVRPPIMFPDVPWAERYAMLKTRFMDLFTRWATNLPEGQSALFLEPLNRYEAYFLTRVGQAVEISRAIGSPRILALADLFHMNIEEAHLGKPLEEAGKALGHVHIADNNRFEPGAGCLDFRPAFRALKAIGYEGYLSIECWSPDGPRLSGDAHVILPRTVAHLRQEWEVA
jgi:sugar phosphate isomerase/epimerase